MNEIHFLIYAIIFRISIISVGSLSVYFGYRLFVLGVMPIDGTDIESKAGNVRLTIRNAAPGTLFAMAGLAIIGLMIYQGNPAYEVKRQRDAKTTTESVSMRGEENPRKVAQHDIVPPIDEREEVSQIRRTLLAKLKDPMANLTTAKPIMIALAALELKQERNIQAGVYAKIAYVLADDSPEILALNAKIEELLGNRSKATELMAKVKEISPDFSLNLDELITGGLK